MTRTYRAPGRVNLIGEHTDYNLGFVMPVAVGLACEVESNPPARPGILRISSDGVEGVHDFPVADLAVLPPAHNWTDYVIGVAQQLLSSGIPVEPADLRVRSTVPVGAGLSSSAALEVASALALAGESVIDKLELARLCHRCETDFVGLPCGMMDQFISVFGRADRAIQLDCRSLDFEEVELPRNVTVLAVNTMVKHELGSTAYRQRVAECAEAARAIGVPSLRDATLDDIGRCSSATSRRRARHIISENLRVVEFAKAARRADLFTMGQLFLASHRSLQYDYEVSCAELDFLVDTALSIDGVYGARMTGGGFGGCTVNLVSPDHVAAFSRSIAEAYEYQYGIRPAIYECRPSDGASAKFS